eukprot:GHVT01020464.1.p1 GENE.GHVT01020464.1~~GHVT01020464.1.p1  ORF type:complete len:162 (+),score=52.23 GHVT01020464.1:880-1365(+)
MAGRENRQQQQVEEKQYFEIFGDQEFQQGDTFIPRHAPSSLLILLLPPSLIPLPSFLFPHPLPSSSFFPNPPSSLFLLLPSSSSSLILSLPPPPPPPSLLLSLQSKVVEACRPSFPLTAVPPQSTPSTFPPSSSASSFPAVLCPPPPTPAPSLPAPRLPPG